MVRAGYLFLASICIFVVYVILLENPTNGRIDFSLIVFFLRFFFKCLKFFFKVLVNIANRYLILYLIQTKRTKKAGIVGKYGKC